MSLLSRLINLIDTCYIKIWISLKKIELTPNSWVVEYSSDHMCFTYCMICQMLTNLLISHYNRVPNTEPKPYDPERERGRSRGPRRQLTDFAVTPSEYSPISLIVGNPLYYSSSEDSNSEHSVQSYASSPCQEHPGELPWPYQHQYGYQYTSFNDNHIPQRCSPTHFYKNPQYQSSPSFSRRYMEDGWGHPLEMDSGSSSYMSRQAPSPVYSSNGHYEYCYSEALPSHQRICKLLPAHVKLSRAPSLREYSHHPSRGLPRQVVSEELKSWHQRNQLQPPRPHSLDRNRQGTLRIRNAPGQESPLSLSQHHRFQEQQVNRLSSQSLKINVQKMYWPAKRKETSPNM